MSFGGGAPGGARSGPGAPVTNIFYGAPGTRAGARRAISAVCAVIACIIDGEGHGVRGGLGENFL